MISSEKKGDSKGKFWDSLIKMYKKSRKKVEKIKKIVVVSQKIWDRAKYDCLKTQSYQGFERPVPKNIFFTYCC